MRYKKKLYVMVSVFIVLFFTSGCSLLYYQSSDEIFDNSDESFNCSNSEIHVGNIESSSNRILGVIEDSYGGKDIYYDNGYVVHEMPSSSDEIDFEGNIVEKLERVGAEVHEGITGVLAEADGETLLNCYSVIGNDDGTDILWYNINTVYLMTRDAELVFEDGMPASEDDLKPGTAVLVQYDRLYETYPGQMHCTKVVVLT